MTRPNILYIHSHDTGRYIQPYGYAMDTPNLQRLAEQGVIFRQAFCVGPTCSPSRAGLLTGQCAHSAGMLGLAHPGFGFRLRDYTQHLIHTLRQVGYESTLCGFQHVADWHDSGKTIGYDRVLDTGDEAGGTTERIANEAAQFLGEKPAEPFFLSVGFIATHRQFPPHEPADDPRFMRPPAPLPDTPETRRDMADFRTLVRQLDHGMGTVLAALEQAGLADNTLVICTTDHGIAFPWMKCNLTDHGIGIMLLMRGPGGFEGGRVIDGMVSHVDVFPTLCELLEIEPPDWLQGTSIMPLVRGEAEEVHDAIFAEVTFHGWYEPQRAVRTQRHKYIRRYEDWRYDGRNCDGSISKDLFLANGWADQPADRERLFDLFFDPHETHNLVDDPAHAHILDEMRARLDRWMQETNDPLLQGAVATPKSAWRVRERMDGAK